MVKLYHTNARKQWTSFQVFQEKIHSAPKRGFGIVACCEGKVYYYLIRNTKPFLPKLYGAAVDRFKKEPYNYDEIKAYETVLQQFQEHYGIGWRELD